ncbi:MAG: hypothetical protein GX663_03265 [Clostridiales bacterium]|nr:hypothetical protein [Clostridiales bacterium]
MNKIDIKVKQDEAKHVAYWFCDVHTNSGIDFFYKDNILCLINEKKESLRVGKIEKEELLEMIIENIDEDDKVNGWLLNCVRDKDPDRAAIFDFVDEDEWGAGRYLDYYLSIDNNKLKKNRECTWAVGNIDLEDPEEGDDAFRIISIEIKPAQGKTVHSDWQRNWFYEKRDFENKLYLMYSQEDEDIQVPRYFKRTIDPDARRELIFDMLFALKVEYNIDEKFSELSEGRVKRIFDDLSRKPGFKDMFFDPLMALHGFTKQETGALLMDKLTDIVFAHECGRMTFREICISHDDVDTGTAANWFAALMVDDFEKKLLEFMTPYQPEEWGQFIEVPPLFGLQIEEYLAYCDKLDKLFER